MLGRKLSNFYCQITFYHSILFVITVFSAKGSTLKSPQDGGQFFRREQQHFHGCWWIGMSGQPHGRHGDPSGAAGYEAGAVQEGGAVPTAGLGSQLQVAGGNIICSQVSVGILSEKEAIHWLL